MNEKSNPTAAFKVLLDFIARSKHTWWRVAEKHGLTLVQLHALALLSDEPRQMNFLCNTLICDASNVTGLVDRLSAHGLLERHDHPEDRRVKMVTLTEKGRRVRDQAIREMACEGDYSLATLTSEELAAFTRLLQKITPHP